MEVNVAEKAWVNERETERQRDRERWMNEGKLNLREKW